MQLKNTRPPRPRQAQHPDPAEAAIILHRRRRDALEGVAGLALASPLWFAAEGARLGINAADFADAEDHGDLLEAVGAALEVAGMADPDTPPRIVRECALQLAGFRCSRLGDLANLHPNELARLALEGGRSVDPDDPFAAYPSAAERLEAELAEARRLANMIRAAGRFAAEARMANLKMVRLLEGRAA